MGETTLVEPDIEAGRAALRQLDLGQLPLDAAFWLLQPEGEWRFFLHTPLVESRGRSFAYRKLQEALKGYTDRLPLRRVTLLRQDDPLLQLLRVAISTGGKGAGEIRFSRNTINGTYIEDAVIYRI